LETPTRKLAGLPGSAAGHVSTGLLYEKSMPQLPRADEAHLVSSGYWKLVGVRGAGGVEAIGFMMDQNLARSAFVCAAGNRADLLKLDHRPGLRIFPSLDGAAFGAVLATVESI